MNPAGKPGSASGAISQALGTSLVVFSVGLALTALAYLAPDSRDSSAAQRRLDEVGASVTAQLEDRILALETTLRAAAVFQEQAADVSAADWANFTSQLLTSRLFSGIHEIGFARLVPRAELPAHLAAARRNAPAAYRIWPEGEREQYAPIQYYRPARDRSPPAHGFDLLFEPEQRNTLEQARRLGRPVLSGQLPLEFDPATGVQNGFFMATPIHRRGTDERPAGARAGEVDGWVYCFFRSAVLFDPLIASPKTGRPSDIAVEIFEGEELTPSNRLFSSLPGDFATGFRQIAKLTAVGRTWSLRFTQAERPFGEPRSEEGSLIALGGATTSLLLSALLFSLVHTRTQSIQLTERLRKSEERWHYALEGAGDGMWDWNASTNEVFYSRQWKAMLGFAEHEIEGKFAEWDQRIHPDDRENVHAELNRHLRGETPAYASEHRVRCKDGTYRWVLDRGKVIARNPDGEPLRMIGTHTDISAHKLAEEQLKRANLIIEQSGCSFMITDNSGVIEYVNDEFTRATGYTLAEAAGRNPRFLGSGRNDPATYAEMWQTLLAGRTWKGAFQNRKKNGTDHWEAVAISPLRDTSGQTTHFVCVKQDVSELKRLQLALQESLANFRTFFESMTDLIFVGRTDGRILFTNHAVTQTLGYSSDELAGKHLLEMHPAALRAEAEQILTAMFSGQRTICSLPLVTKGGELIPVETRVWFGRWNDTDCIFGISKNLTTELEAQQRFEQLFRHNPSLIALCQLPEMRFTDVNHTFLRTLGYSAEDVVGRTAAELGLYPDLAGHAAAIEQMLREGRIQNLALQVRQRDGTLLDGLFAGEVIRNQGGQYLLTVMNDVTALRRLELALKESNNRLSLAVRAGRIGIWEYDVARDQLEWDDQMLQLFGLRREEFGGNRAAWWNRIPPADWQRCDAEFDQALRDGTNLHLEHRVCLPDGTVRHVDSMAIIERDAGGKAVRLVGVNWDITERKEREREDAAQLERLRELSEMKSRFISVASHEFRTPMTAATASVELLHNHFNRIPPEKRQAILVRVQFSMRRMNEILDEVLTSNRLERSQVCVSYSIVDLRRVLLEIIEEIRASDRNLHVITLDASHEIIPLVTDSKLLQHIVSNLISNAIRYSPAGTTIAIRLTLEADHVELGIEDEGIGIPPADRERIFLPFERGSNVGAIQGTGLGLNIVKQMTELLNGGITVTDGAKRGTKFTVSFPLKPAAATAAL